MKTQSNSIVGMLTRIEAELKSIRKILKQNDEYKKEIKDLPLLTKSGSMVLISNIPFKPLQIIDANEGNHYTLTITITLQDYISTAKYLNDWERKNYYLVDIRDDFGMYFSDLIKLISAPARVDKFDNTLKLVDLIFLIK